MLHHFHDDFIWLVASTYPSEKWWSSSVGMILPNWMESHNKSYINHVFQYINHIFMINQVIKFHGSKPPTSHGIRGLLQVHPTATRCPAWGINHQWVVHVFIYLSIYFLVKKIYMYIYIYIYIYICKNCHIRLILYIYIYIHIMVALFIWDMYHQFAFFMGGIYIYIHKPWILTDGWWHV